MGHLTESASVMVGFNEEFVKRYRKWGIGIGVLLTLVGIAGAVVPQITSIVVDVFLGWLLIMAGVLAAYIAFLGRWHSMIAWAKPVLLIIIGGLFLYYPAVGIAAMALLLTTYLLLDAFSSFGLAYDYYPLNGWIWMVINGVVSLALAVFVLMGWPITSVIFVGLYVGLSLMFDGLTLIFMSLAAGKAVQS